MNKPNKATVKAMKENLKNQPRFKTVKALIMDLNKKLTAKSPQKPSRRSKRIWRLLENGEKIQKGDQFWFFPTSEWLEVTGNPVVYVDKAVYRRRVEATDLKDVSR